MAGKNAWKSVKLPSLKVICRKLTTTYLRNVAALNYRPFNCGGKGKFRAPPVPTTIETSVKFRDYVYL